MTTHVPNDIYPAPASPYYIVAPHYIRTSAGIRVLHLLCHSLNRRGQAAYIILIGEPNHGGSFCLDLSTPVLTLDALMEHYRRGLAPVMVYPETISGNPFRSPCVVRYILNFPGLLGGEKDYSSEELCFSYSKILAKATRSPENVLYLPPIDTRTFHPPASEQKRSGSCFYAGKYKAIHKGKLFDVTRQSVEITRDLPTSQTPQEIAELFRRSEVFYTYENTALATEAVLCGCPAVFLPNPYLTHIIAEEELGIDGYAWGDDPDQIVRAKATVQQGAESYRKSTAKYWHELDRFIELSQEHARARQYTRPVDILNVANAADRKNAISPSSSASLTRETIREIAREVWYEKQRWGLAYKVGKWLTTRSQNND